MKTKFSLLLALAAMLLAPIGHGFAQTDAVTKENKELKQIIGELTVQMGRQQKRGWQ